MRLVTFDKHGRPAPGVRRGDSIVDLAAAATGLKSDWPAIFAAGQLGRVAEIARSASGKTLLPAARTKLWVPIPDPPKIPCIGLNYVSHARETGMAIPDYPTVFNRFATSFAAPGAALIRPRASEAFDYEAELVIVIGKAGRHIAKEKALEHVAGYACGNDGSLRDYQMKTTQWLIGKNFDASGSWGPEIVTPDELPPGARGLGIRCRLNGETLQDGNT
ncbi:MAG TPA: fumarylacetoacetate hydrolase family protein, partial [Kiloniellales bacterium]|nr:fumarylacetoacetate hydrolase family protein [Kiloniellales bacterium]